MSFRNLCGALACAVPIALTPAALAQDLFYVRWRDPQSITAQPQL